MRWYDKEEEYLHRLQEMCTLLSKHYMNLYIKTHRVQTKLRLPAIILSSCSGVASFGSSGFSANTMRYITITVGVINVMIAILQTYESYLKIGDIVSKSLSASQSLKKLADDIQCEIFIPIEDRNANGVTFLRDCFSRYQAILDQAPPIEELTNAKMLRSRITHELERQNASMRASRVMDIDGTRMMRDSEAIAIPMTILEEKEENLEKETLSNVVPLSVVESAYLKMGTDTGSVVMTAPEERSDMATQSSVTVTRQ